MDSHESTNSQGKRKADSSPDRESHGQAAAVKDYKRRHIADSSDPASITTSASEDDKLAKPESDDIGDTDTEDEEEEEDEGDKEDEEDSENVMEEEDFDDDDDDDEMNDFGFRKYDYEEEEDEGPIETEVEMREESLDETRLTFKIFLAEDDEEFISWMSTIYVQCSHNGKDIGRGYGRYIQRDRIRPTFWRDMEEPSEELSKVAFGLFDRYGRLKKEFKDHPIRKGTGAWGSELDLGSFLVIEDLHIDKEWRRRGIGKRIALHLLEKSRTGGRNPEFSLTIPGWLTRDVESDIEGKTKLEQREIEFGAVDAAESFWRSLGFRRIGASSCFGLAKDASHAAHSILPTDDFDPVTEDPEFDEEPEDERFAEWDVEPAKKSWRLVLLKDRLPLHHAALTLSDSECVEFFSAFEMSDKLGDEWVKLDRSSKNVLHIAASELKPKSVHWLLASSGYGETLGSARNVDGDTPLEQLEFELEIKRTRRNHGMMAVDISDTFPGFTAEAIECLAALRGIKNPTPIDTARLKFGCTCSSCIDGFLSPRMKFALLCQAEMRHELLSQDVSNGKMWCMVHDDLFTYVAPDIQQNFATNKSYRQGFANVFHHVAAALRHNNSPTITNTLREYEDASEWPPHTKSFFQRGGTVESVLHIIFDKTRDQDEWAGDGEHMHIFEEDIKALPECRNDQEFGSVALACGVQNSHFLYG